MEILFRRMGSLGLGLGIIIFLFFRFIIRNLIFKSFFYSENWLFFKLLDVLKVYWFRF